MYKYELQTMASTHFQCIFYCFEREGVLGLAPEIEQNINKESNGNVHIHLDGKPFTQIAVTTCIKSVKFYSSLKDRDTVVYEFVKNVIFQTE